MWVTSMIVNKKQKRSKTIVVWNYLDTESKTTEESTGATGGESSSDGIVYKLRNYKQL